MTTSATGPVSTRPSARHAAVAALTLLLERIQVWWWLGARRRAMLAWAVFYAWQALGIHLGLPKHMTTLGVVDAFAFWTVALLATAAMLGLPGPVRLPMLGFTGVFVLLLNAGNALFVSFFDTYINLDTWKTLTQAGAAATGVEAQLSGQFIYLHVAVPAVLLAVALMVSATRTPRTSPLIPLALLGGGLAMVVHPVLSHRTFTLSEHNPIMHVGRQWVGRQWETYLANEHTWRADIMSAIPASFNLPPETEYRSLTSERFPFLKIPVNPTQKAERPLNVVLILMESFRQWETGVSEHRDGVAPNLRALMDQSLTFTNFYANAHQTVRGELATLCSSLPNYTRGQVYTAYPTLGMMCLPQALKQMGYQTHWISSYTSRYANKRGFLQHHGIDNFHDNPRDGRTLIRPVMGWGPSDEDLAEYAVATLDKAQVPFFAEVMTLTNHYPFDSDYPIEDGPVVAASPERQVYKDYLRGMHYTDHAVHKFLEAARTRPWFNNTLFVLLGDHGIFIFPEKRTPPLSPAERLDVYFRVPLLFYAPGHIKPQRNLTLGSQVDVAPTILEWLGVRVPNGFVGANLLQDIPPQRRHVVMGNENNWHIRGHNRYCYVLEQQCFKTMAPACPPGYEPRNSGYSCFEYDGDLSDTRQDRSRLRLLEDVEATALMETGESIVSANNHLIITDALFPHDPSLTLGQQHGEPAEKQ